MRLNNYVKSAILGLGLLCFSIPSAHAFGFPTLDISVVTQKIKTITTQINQYKTQIMESKVVGSINSAIGDAKASIAKFKANTLEAVKANAEKAKKAVEKAKKIKEDIEKRKKEFEEKKKAFADYKEKLEAQAKQIKDKVDEAKDTVEGIKDQATNAVNSARDQVSGTINTVNNTVNSAKDNVTGAVSGVTGAVGQASSNFANHGTNAGGSSYGNYGNGNVSTSTSAGYAGNTSGSYGGATTAAPNASFGGATTAAPSASFGGGATTAAPSASFGGGATTAAPSASFGGGATTAPTTRGNASTGGSGPASSPAGRAANSSGVPAQPSGTPSVSATGEPQTNATSAGDPIETIRQIAEEQGGEAAADALNEMIATATAQGDIETLQAIADIDVSDFITSSDKVYDEEESEENSTSFGQTQADMAEDILGKGTQNSTPSSPSQNNPATSASSTNTLFGGAASSSTVPNVPSSPANLNSPSSGIGSSFGEPSTPTFEEPSTSNTASPTGRQPFGSPKSSFWIDNGDRARRNEVKLSYTNTSTLKFASVSTDCDYSNSIISKDDGEITLISKTLAQECCIKVENLSNMNVIKDCVNKMLEKMHDPDSTIKEDANSVYAQIMAEQNIYGMIEAMDNVNKSVSYVGDVLMPYVDKMNSGTTTGDNISSISMTNTQMLYLLNRLRRIYTSASVASSLGGVGDILSNTLDEDTELGIGSTGEHYDASITRIDGEYPIIPENMAIKNVIDVKTPEGLAKVKEAYLQAVADAHNSDITEAAVGQAYVENIQYQDMLNVLGKSLAQKKKSVEYDEKLEKTEETVTDVNSIHTNNEALAETEQQITQILDDIVNMYASRIANGSLEEVSRLTPQSTYKPAPTGTEG